MSAPETAHILALLEREYDMRAPEIQPLGGSGISSSVFLVRTGEGTYVAKESKWYLGFAPNPVDTLEAVYTTIQALKNRGIPVQGAMQTVAGSYSSCIGDVPWVVLDFIDGHAFSGEEQEWSSAGRALGRLHSGGAALMSESATLQNTILTRIPTEKPYEESRALYPEIRDTLLAEHECSHPDTCNAFRNHVDALEAAMQYVDEAFASGSTRSILHNDFNFENGIYKENGDFSGFIDADQLGYGPVVHDIGNTLASFVTNAHTTTDGVIQEGVLNFLQTYHGEFPLSAEEYRRIPAGAMRWDLLRLLRSLRRHHFEGNRFSGLLRKIPITTIPRILSTRETFSFLTTDRLGTVGIDA